MCLGSFVFSEGKKRTSVFQKKVVKHSECMDFMSNFKTHPVNNKNCAGEILLLT